MTRAPLATAVGVLLCAAPAASQTPPADKSPFSLFNPTPRTLMREMQTDRPDQTESPYTVDAGHFQLEADFDNYTYDRRLPRTPNTHYQNLTLADVNLKL